MKVTDNIKFTCSQRYINVIKPNVLNVTTTLTHTFSLSVGFQYILHSIIDHEIEIISLSNFTSKCIPPLPGFKVFPDM